MKTNTDLINPGFALFVAAMAVVLTIIGCASNQSPSAQTPKSGKPLVTSLPAQLQGVQLVGRMVKVKPGYQWVKHPNGTVTVARMAVGGGGGNSLGGTWSCDCVSVGAKGTCTTTNTGSGLFCYKAEGDTCAGSCQLKVSTSGLTKAIIMY